MKRPLAGVCVSLTCVALVAWGCTRIDSAAVSLDAAVARHARLKESTVRVWVGDAPAGSGFVVDSRGLVATNYHVIMARSEIDERGEMPGVAEGIRVELHDGRVLEARAVSCLEHNDLWLSRSKDFAVLEIDADGLRPLALGRFSDVSEGSAISLAGFPLGIDQPVVTSGSLSTKWTAPAEFGHSGTREVAWLDVTLNRGNSGGPVVAHGTHPGDERVVGIATFQLNPFAGPAERLVESVLEGGSDLVIPGFSIKQLAVLTGEALSHNSLGIGGCVAVDYLDEWLRERSN